jgi:hypothetical protein
LVLWNLIGRATVSRSAKLTQLNPDAEQAQTIRNPPKNFMNRCASNTGISVVILIRTDTTLDHSQKAEKVCLCKLAIDLVAKFMA